MSRFDHHRVLPDEERYALYRALRSGSIGHTDAYGGAWLLPRYHDVVAALEDWQTFSSAESVLLPPPGGRRSRQVALEQDPPEHTIYRKRYTELLSRSRVRAIEPEIRRIAAARIDELARNGGGDFVAAVAAPVPIETVGLLLGLDPDVTERLRELTVAELGYVDRDGTAPRPDLTLNDLLRSVIEDRRARPQDDFVTMLAQDDLPPTGLLSFLVGAVIAGHETTLSAASNLAYQLASDQALHRRLAADPAAVAAVVDESLRHRSPVQAFARTVTADTEVAGRPVAVGDKVIVLYGAANRDPDAYPDPDRFVADRFAEARGSSAARPPKHLAFGWGIHRCPGAFLAERELHLIAEELLRYDLSLRAEPRFAPTLHGAFLAIERLDLDLTPRT